MRSNDEEYLDSLLTSAQKSSSSNPQSALSRMSSKSGGSLDAAMGRAPSDLADLMQNSGGNKDLDEIGDILDKLDKNEIVDEGMEELITNIEKPTDPDIPTFTVGGDVFDVRDPEEIALDEAIAEAERLSSGDQPLVDIEEGDDALLEMAPEDTLAENDQINLEKEIVSDDNESPEEILGDLLDAGAGDTLSSPDQVTSAESLSDILDNMKDDEPVAEDIPDSIAADDAPVEAEPDILDAGNDNGIDLGLGADDKIPDLEDFSIDDVEKVMDESLEGDSDEPESPAEDIENASEDNGSIEDTEEALNLGGFTLDGADVSDLSDIPADSSADVATGDEESESDSNEISFEDALSEMGLMEDLSETGDKESSDGLDNGADGGIVPEADAENDELDLSNLEASLDDLLESDQSDSTETEGEVAETETEDLSDDEELSMKEIDDLMNSLAGDELDDIENLGDESEEGGEGKATEENEVPKQDILEALTEDIPDEGEGELSLDQLVAMDGAKDDIPEKPSKKSGKGSKGDDSGKGKKEKKEKKPGFFARLFEALTKEDEDEGAELASLTEENQKVLDELGEEDAANAGGKGKGAKKEKKPKKEKAKKEKPKKEKAPKEPKPKKEKPKKEKKPKEPKEPEKPQKVISPKKIAVSGIFAASLGILVLLPSLILPDRVASERASSAFTHREYTTAYKVLFGKELGEDESIIYNQSRVQAWANRYLDGYNNYTAMGMDKEALDMLLMAMRNKDDVLKDAGKYGVEIEVNSVYDSIELLLSQQYGLSAADADAINAIKKDRDYTIRLMEIVGEL